jgi:hypothetical protein
MLDFTGALDLSSIAIADALVTKTDAQDRHLGLERANNVVGYASLLWGARAGRDDNALRCPSRNFTQAHLVVANHPYLLTQLTEILKEVIGKTIVVIY